MTTQQNANKSPLRFLWLTIDFASCLTDSLDSITPQLFLALMAHPAINQIKRFTSKSENLGPEDVTQWEPAIFTMQTYRASLLDVLRQVSSQLATYLGSDNTPVNITIYTQLGDRHCPITTSLDSKAIEIAAQTIEAMVAHYEQT